MDQTAAQELTDVDAVIEGLVRLTMAAGPVAGGIIVTIAVLFLGTKYLGIGFTIGSKKTLVDEEKVDGVASGIATMRETLADHLNKVEDRISELERDIERRATRDEMHKLELAFTKMEGRFETIDQRTAATAHAVGRIESFMYEAAMRSRGDK